MENGKWKMDNKKLQEYVFIIRFPFLFSILKLPVQNIKRL